MVVMIITALNSCMQSQTDVDTVGEQNKEIVKNFIDAVFRADTAHMGEFLSESYMQYGPGMKDSLDKEQQIRTWRKGWTETYQSITYDRVAILAHTVTPQENPRVVGDWVMEWGNITAEFKNGTPTTKFRVHAVFRVANGKIEREFVYYNQADVLSQQGFKFVPPSQEVSR